MEYSPICSLLRETIILIRSFSSNFNSAKRNAVASDFIHDLEKNKATNNAGKWTGESEVRALRFSPHILGNRCEHHFKTMHEVAFGIVSWVNNGIFHRNLEATKLANTIIEECVNVANKYGITLYQDKIEEKLILVSKRADGQLISTYEDIRNRRRTEIDSLNLEISNLADKTGMPELVTNTRLLGEMIQLKSNLVQLSSMTERQPEIRNS